MRTHLEYWRKKSTDYQYLNENGKIISLTRVNNPPSGFGEKYFWVGVIKLSKQKKRTTGQIVASKKEPQIGDQVVGVLRKIGKPGKKEVIQYGVKFKCK
jgi:uncharacterized OB-fold protein